MAVSLSSFEVCGITVLPEIVNTIRKTYMGNENELKQYLIQLLITKDLRNLVLSSNLPSNIDLMHNIVIKGTVLVQVRT